MGIYVFASDHNGFQMRVKTVFNECRIERNLEFLWFLLYKRSMIGLKKLTPPTQPIRCKIKTNRDLVSYTCTRVFPCLAQVTCICFEFSLVCCVVYACCHWLRAFSRTYSWTIRSPGLQKRAKTSRLFPRLVPIKFFALNSDMLTICSRNFTTKHYVDLFFKELTIKDFQSYNFMFFILFASYLL